MTDILPSGRCPGALPVDGGVRFIVWAPEHDQMALRIEGRGDFGLQKASDGYFEATIEGAAIGDRYWLRPGDSSEWLADPASRWQPEGPEGPSEVVGSDYEWTDRDWPGLRIAGQVVMEMHVGSFTPEGTWAAAMDKLPLLVDTGITLIEMMPVATFRGRFGWGYDGTHLFSPYHHYGRPDDLRAFIDRAHALGLGMILDVVYNHFGHGNRTADFSRHYFKSEENDWGKVLNFDGPQAQGVRDHVIGNAVQWIRDFHFDGLRLDAVQEIKDECPRHIVGELVAACRKAAGERSIVMIGEIETQKAKFARPEPQGGMGLDAIWNDDFHHSARVALTGRREAYYHDHHGRPQEFVSSAKFGFQFQGQRYDWQMHARGTPARDLGAAQFVHFLDNHDQIANSGRGMRVHQLGSPARTRALTALLLLGPQTPMLFQGQDFAASQRFLYFSEQGELDDAIAEGRKKEMTQFPSLRDPAMESRVMRPASPECFAATKLDWAERDAHGEWLALHRDLIRLRKSDPVLSLQPNARSGGLDGSVVSEDTLMLRWFAQGSGTDRLLLINLGRDLAIRSIPDALYAPPEGTEWRVMMSTEDPAYGGAGRAPIDLMERWTLPADCALLFGASRAAPRPAPEVAELKAFQRDLEG
ncbi:maltooligosyltrehalose trehalohydrolase [Devosia enhydra]|uniref:Maltooligosyltrehalose trehalohydrolase n=1 Tax=Devosia enhydra TaxID=665118 RepID=A0A1K2I415_9HYPH|nr:alpha-amylase family glycosyl hydrolase [Devosia enhydra]SFZ86476.1 maltooligosyltrehalose trehalohydrolase [Devosia enhydra]